MDDILVEILHWTTRAIEVAGILVIVIGCVAAGLRYLGDRVGVVGEPGPYHRLRSGIGRSILLGLELLVAADIINTVAIEPTLQSLAVLAGIVLIRTFLSLSLEVEIEGRWPWQNPPGRDRTSLAP
jgi:uncharacterized membrane protein